MKSGGRREAEHGLTAFNQNFEFFKFTTQILIEAEARLAKKNSVCISKKTQHFSIAKISWLMLFKEIILFILRILRNP
jgi:hypothetical protein